VLLSDITVISNMLAKEFPDIIKLKEIGKTHEDRPMMAIELDARALM
jgi:hypothetical protein